MGESKTIIYSTILAFIDMIVLNYMFNTEPIDGVSVKFILDIIFTISTFVVMVISYGKILINKRVFIMIYLLVTCFSSLKILFNFGEGRTMFYRDMKHVVFAIIIYIVIIGIVRVTFIGFEKLSKRELPQIILVVFIFMLPVVSKLYLAVDIAMMLSTQILFISMLGGNKNGRVSRKDRSDSIRDNNKNVESDNNVE